MPRLSLYPRCLYSTLDYFPYPTNPIFFFLKYSIWPSLVCTATFAAPNNSLTGTRDNTTVTYAVYRILGGLTACS
jgi:hypothetical protein